MKSINQFIQINLININKILISILIMSILITAAIVTSADIDNAVSVSTNTSENIEENISNPTSDTPVVEIQESKKLTPTEEKTRFENRKKNIEKLIKQKGVIMSPSPSLMNKTAINRTSKTATTKTTIPITSTITYIPEIWYTNPITQISIFGKDLGSASIYIDNGDNIVYKDWFDYSFYIPVASYVNVNTFG